MLYDPKWTPVEIKLEPWQEILLKAADLIEKHGWLQRGYGSVYYGFCAMGAILEATPEATCFTETKKATWALRDQAGVIHVPAWNDAPDRTKEDVINTMRKAAANAV